MDENLDCAFVENALIFIDPWFWKVNRIELSWWPDLNYGSHPPDYYDYSVPNAAMGRDSGGSGEMEDNKIKHEDGDQFIPLPAYTDQPPLHSVPG